jgi:hypothetical protein
MACRSLADRDHLERSCRFHRKILNAIKAKDKPRSEALTRDHILKGMAAQKKAGKGLFATIQTQRDPRRLHMLLPEVKKHYGKLKFLIGGSGSTDVRQNRADVNPATGEVIAEFPRRPRGGDGRRGGRPPGVPDLKTPLRERAYMLFTMHKFARTPTCSAGPGPDHGRTIEEARARSRAC